MENVKKVCPHCGSSVFASILNVMSIIDVSEGLDNFKVLKSDIDNASINCICKCVNCKNDVTEQDLIGGVQCAQCSEYVPQEDINEEGLCPACAMLKQNNASPTELLRMLIAEQKKGSYKSEQVAKKQEVAKKAQEEQAINDKIAEIQESLDDTEKAPEEVTEEAPKRRGRPKRGKSANKEENASEENTPAEDTSFEGSMNQPETINDLDTEQAPFPEVTEEDKALGEELPSFADEIINDSNNQDSFNMFDTDNNDQAF
jgi:hypothetical protein